MNNSLETLNLEDLEIINGGKINAATISGAAGSVYGAVVGAGAIGWLGAGAVAVCSAPVVAGSAAVVGIAGAGLAVYSLL